MTGTRCLVSSNSAPHPPPLVAGATAVTADTDVAADDASEARRRWRLLSKAILEKRSTRSLQSFLLTPGAASGVMAYQWVSQSCYRVTCHNTPVTVYIRLPQQLPPLTPDQLAGFDNTGNICVWSSEELLLHYCVAAHKRWTGRRLLELAGGSTALAGLWVSASGVCSHVTLSDGHPSCVAGIRGCVAQNTTLPTHTSVRWLQWPLEGDSGKQQQQYDVILAADCVFQERNHGPLSDAIWQLLSEGGECVVAAPHRTCGNRSSLTQFAQVMANRGFTTASLGAQASFTKDVHTAATKIGASLRDNQKPHILLLQKPYSVRYTDMFSDSHDRL